MKWGRPPEIKVYEALGAIADGRVRVQSEGAQVYSSSGNKFYTVSYDAASHAIMANDNGSYWKGYLGYPAIAYLMQVGVLSYSPELGEVMKGIPWKDINQKFKNDFVKTLEHILSNKTEEEKKALHEYASKVLAQVDELDLTYLGQKVMPPAGY